MHLYSNTIKKSDTEELFFCTTNSKFVIICAFTVQFQPCKLLEKEDFAGKQKLCKLMDKLGMTL